MTSWKLTLPCTRAEAEAIDAGEDLGLELPPVLMTTEEVTDDVERWRLDAYFEHQPDAAAVAAIRRLVASTADPLIEPIEDADWVTMSQAGLAPICEGRFVVHTASHPAPAPPGGRAFLIEAGRAFGTGHHETTAGCLGMLDALASDNSFADIVDLGTGTGLLAFAASELWPAAHVLATDIDPIAIEVTRINMAANAIEHVELRVADGAQDLGASADSQFDLIIANILAGPLIAMAPEIAAIAAPSAVIILAGLLETQREAVVAAYAACGCVVTALDRRGDWTILRLQAGEVRYVPATPPDPKGRDGWALDL